MMKTIRIYCAIAVMVLCTTSASAQWITNSDIGFKAPFSKVETPTPSFHSTSTMLSCNSKYASTPTISSNGLAGDDSTDNSHPKNPRKIIPPVPGGDPTPIGDAILPLLLLAAAYTVVRRRGYAFCRVMIEKDAKNQTI